MEKLSFPGVPAAFCLLVARVLALVHLGSVLMRFPGR